MIPSDLFDRLAFGDQKSPAIVRVDKDGNMRIVIGDDVFMLDCIKNREACSAINKGLQDAWVFDNHGDTAIVPVSRLRRLFVPPPQARLSFHLDLGFAVICEETADGWQLVELEPGIDEPVDEPIEYESFADCLYGACKAIIQSGLSVGAVTVDGLRSALGALDSQRWPRLSDYKE